MTFGQVIELNKKKILFFENHPENKADRLVSDIILFFEKPLCNVNIFRLQLIFNIF